MTDMKMVFDAVREIKGGALSRGDVDRLNAALAGGATRLTQRGAAEVIHHEAIVLEAYRDNAVPPRWTWSVGLTVASGTDVLAYKDKPSTIEVALRAYVGRLRRVYIPDVVDAFGAYPLSEAQFAAAVSFHFNTGAIETTSWVKLLLAGKAREARAFLETHYLNAGVLKERRMREAALFFDGKWDGDGRTATILGVAKPSYTPSWKSARKVDISADLTKAMAA